MKRLLLALALALLCAGCECAATCEGCWFIGHPFSNPCGSYRQSPDRRPR
jgi:hypothetical protein